MWFKTEAHKGFSNKPEHKQLFEAGTPAFQLNPAIIYTCPMCRKGVRVCPTSNQALKTLANAVRKASKDGSSNNQQPANNEPFDRFFAL